ncbi:MAG: Fe-S cluster assembly scaffold SufA [Gammaproteobacteria bacterium CG_4_10_14_0_8_um_filter_38_16]|nr:MAG: Fe-S cluster assembly scaffold SufA [Gammaproteobacteria bacterium CG_4_10_14_0_8_um_filter_38_16]PJA02613.1 MAG: Fe-S cluster assembly scaffold SufA [Gammaproteobacteria bacterium CG_4_10_14_0_2_um_filter_38_22]PJB11069.1 MAG: Fe-S cluster assembly scaffold SufA [Gammaproteobacteria bacterium CG_4_9_14_3_um_filter_38_9]
MITLTAAATEHIQKMLEKKGENATFRLSIKQTGCSGYMYIPEIVFEKKESDVVVHADPILIYIDENAVTMIKGTVIDYVKKSLGQSQLEFNNPNAAGLCGCGESFQIRKKP